MKFKIFPGIPLYILFAKRFLEPLDEGFQFGEVFVVHLPGG